MSVPGALRTNFSPLELEFVAEEALVEIIPSIRLPQTRLLSGRPVGPFTPPSKAEVPLWMAVNLKKKKKCRIIPPRWLTLDNLELMLREETRGEAFAPLPFNYMELSRILLEAAPDDIPQPERIRSLLKDLREVRQGKAREGIQHLNPVELNVTGFSQMELNEIRPFFSLAFKRLLQLDPQESERLEQAADEPEELEDPELKEDDFGYGAS
ncbi:Psf2-domain-containing protein [Cystobasidium minutum MCA 4210]|uniref:Psf2-domain-containing protein n=1 Tax=Cystobasidium minutum MCA 4210 TaxID=1397322 RepID=UPI0034CE8644|eukprot:jgi/Rhomi1/152243/estExt_Genewise1.C_4_t10151